jgi:hypothetical protein
MVARAGPPGEAPGSACGPVAPDPAFILALGYCFMRTMPTSPLLYVAADPFTERFRQAAAATRAEVYLWTLDDLYSVLMPAWS